MRLTVLYISVPLADLCIVLSSGCHYRRGKVEHSYTQRGSRDVWGDRGPTDEGILCERGSYSKHKALV